MIRRNASWIAIGALVVVLAVAVVGFGENSSSIGVASELPTQDPDLVAAGEPLYQAGCASCHGTDLRGTDLGPSHLSVVYEPNHHGDAAFVLAAQNGVRAHHWPFGDMPPVPGLTEQELEAVVAFVREHQRIEGFEPYPP